jgi:hypothetical protein
MLKAELEDAASREEYLERVSSVQSSQSNYNSDLAYDLLEAVFAKEKAEEEGYTEFATELEKGLNQVLEPEGVNNDACEQKDEFLNRIVMHPHIFGESLSSFTRQNGEVKKEGDIANGVIQAELYEEARDYLEEFEKWHREFVADWIQDEGDTFEVADFSYDTFEAGKVAVYNALEHLLYRRMIEEQFSQVEMRVP